MTTSLAGRVAKPRLPDGAVRIGGFGGPDALARWLDENAVDAVVDATHPFAERISASAAQACAATAIPLLRLERPGWSPQPGRRWHRVADPCGGRGRDRGTSASACSSPPAARACARSPDGDAWFLIRCVDPPEPPLPRRCERAARPRPVHAGGRARPDRRPRHRPRRDQGQRRRPHAPPSSTPPASAACRSSSSTARPARPTSRRSPRAPRPPRGPALTPDSAAACTRAGARAPLAITRVVDEPTMSSVRMSTTAASRPPSVVTVTASSPLPTARATTTGVSGARWRSSTERARSSCSRRVREAGL